MGADDVALVLLALIVVTIMYLTNSKNADPKQIWHIGRIECFHGSLIGVFLSLSGQGVRSVGLRKQLWSFQLDPEPELCHRHDDGHSRDKKQKTVRCIINVSTTKIFRAQTVFPLLQKNHLNISVSNMWTSDIIIFVTFSKTIAS
jgi:hypothetical protein